MTTKAGQQEKAFRPILFAICVSVFMANLDTTIVNISLPTISRYFNIGTGEVSWITLSYFLTVTSLLLAFGRLGDILGFRKVFLWGILVFSSGSFLCTLAPGIAEMVIFRVVQGVGGAMIIAVGPAMISAFLPDAVRGRAMGYVITAASVGIAAGPVIGSFLTVYFGWRWIFLVNVPLGFAAVLIGLKWLPGGSSSSRSRFDLLGAALIFASLSLVIFGLNQGNELGWGSSRITGSFALSALCAIGFIIREMRYPDPLVDLRLFFNIYFVLPNLAALLMLLAFGGALFVLPFYMEMGLGLSTVVAGLLLTIISITAAASAPIGGAMYDRLGPRIACLAACASSALSFLLFYFISGSEFHVSLLIAGLALIGIGYGMFAPPTLSLVLGQYPNRRGQVSSIMMTFRDMGIVLGTVLFETVFSASSEGSASIHQASAQMVAHGFHNSVMIGIAATVMALTISSMIRD